MKTKPTVKLVGQDGNAFYILGACRQAAVKAGWSKEQICGFEAAARAYWRLHAAACEHFNVK